MFVCLYIFNRVNLYTMNILFDCIPMTDKAQETLAVMVHLVARAGVRFIEY